METMVTLDDPVRSASVLSKESEVDINIPADPDAPFDLPDSDDEVLSDEESFMTLTQEEQLAWKETIQKLEEALKRQGEDYSEWSDKITRRRMYAYTRMKRLEKINQTRKEFYGNVDDFIQHFHGDVIEEYESKLKSDGEVLKCDSDVQTTVDYKHEDSVQNNNSNVVTPMQAVEDTPVIQVVPESKDNSTVT